MHRADEGFRPEEPQVGCARGSLPIAFASRFTSSAVQTCGRAVASACVYCIICPIYFYAAHEELRAAAGASGKAGAGCARPRCRLFGRERLAQVASRG